MLATASEYFPFHMDSWTSRMQRCLCCSFTGSRKVKSMLVSGRGISSLSNVARYGCKTLQNCSTSREVQIGSGKCLRQSEIAIERLSKLQQAALYFRPGVYTLPSNFALLTGARRCQRFVYKWCHSCSTGYWSLGLPAFHLPVTWALFYRLRDPCKHVIMDVIHNFFFFAGFLCFADIIVF